MKPMIIAKRIWDRAVAVQNKIGAAATYGAAPLYSYPGILTMWTASQAALYSGDDEWLAEVKSYLAKYPFEFEEPGTKFHYNFENYRVGGLGKGWMIMNGHFEDHKDVLREYAEKTINGPHSYDGIACGINDPKKVRIWIDVVYAITPFMLYAGLVFDEPKYIDYAVDQCFKMYDVFMDKSNGLLHQARGFLADPEKISEDHWSRGNGWGIIGLSELVQYLPKDHKCYNEAVERFKAHCDALLKYQDSKGLWKQEIPEKLSWEESSGTGIILYAYGVGMRLGILDKEVYMPAFKKGLEGLVGQCINPDYSVEKCCRGCLCPGQGDLKGTVEAYLVDVFPKKDDSHAFGPILMTMVEAERNGIKNIAVGFNER